MIIQWYDLMYVDPWESFAERSLTCHKSIMKKEKDLVMGYLKS